MDTYPKKMPPVIRASSTQGKEQMDTFCLIKKDLSQCSEKTD